LQERDTQATFQQEAELNQAQIPEEFFTLVQVLAEDAALQEWFVSLAALPANRRYSELGRMSLQLHNAAQNVLGRIIISLNDEQIYQSIKCAVMAMK